MCTAGTNRIAGQISSGFAGIPLLEDVCRLCHRPVAFGCVSMTSTSSSVSDRSGRTIPKQSGQDLREKLSLWESSLATLSDRQKDGVMTLSAVANSRPVPKNVSVRWNVTAEKQLRCSSNFSVHQCTNDSLLYRPMSSCAK